MFFFVATTLIFCSANYYIFHKLTLLLDTSMPVNVLIGIIILFLTAAPAWIPIYSHKGSERSFRIVSCVGYLWLAFIVPFFPLAVIFQLYNMGLKYWASLSGNDPGSLLLSPEAAFFIPLLLSVGIIVYGYFEAKNIRAERLVIRTPKLPEGIERVRIAQISDLHLGAFVRDGMIERVIKMIQEEAPDIIVSTGDLVDGIVDHISHLASGLKDLEAPLGKYAVTGNHEMYGGIKHTLRFTKEAGFTVLRGEGITVKGIINITGVDFGNLKTGQDSRESPRKTEKEILSGLRQGLFTILLKHSSDVSEGSAGLFDLQLSGHTHKGQIFPMHLATMIIFPHFTGYTALAKGSAVYVSRGTGTTGPPVRFLARPEITIIDIVSA